MKKFMIIILCSLTLFSCKRSKEEMITKKWRAAAFESPALDAETERQRIFIDTVGTSTDPETNEHLYQVRNMDSMRTILRREYDMIMEQRETTVINTWLDFKKDGTVISSFGSAPDTVSWYFSDKGELVLDEIKKKGSGSLVKMEVLELNDTILKLQYNDNGFSSIAIFKPEGK